MKWQLLGLAIGAALSASTPALETAAPKALTPSHEQGQAALWATRFLTRFHYKRVPLDDDAALAPYRRLIAPWHPTQPVFAFDPRESSHVRWMLGTLLALTGNSSATRPAGVTA